ncbi:PREDICTED: uncharacterized protein LOC106149399 [Chinchilla lanigera]|uniref:uncharacterized protein LOC106149399 n=1 Tax=Chinchilla lanigera TaxID=34839 RepID=UPI000696B114|nr:PREDICTED: uncharacterized protein LOC106149399 [Chinchilla lanigera]
MQLLWDPEYSNLWRRGGRTGAQSKHRAGPATTLSGTSALQTLSPASNAVLLQSPPGRPLPLRLVSGQGIQLLLHWPPAAPEHPRHSPSELAVPSCLTVTGSFLLEPQQLGETAGSRAEFRGDRLSKIARADTSGLELRWGEGDDSVDEACVLELGPWAEALCSILRAPRNGTVRSAAGAWAAPARAERKRTFAEMSGERSPRPHPGTPAVCSAPRPPHQRCRRARWKETLRTRPRLHCPRAVHLSRARNANFGAAARSVPKRAGTPERAAAKRLQPAERSPALASPRGDEGPASFPPTATPHRLPPRGRAPSQHSPGEGKGWAKGPHP